VGPDRQHSRITAAEHGECLLGRLHEDSQLQPGKAQVTNCQTMPEFSPDA